MRIESVADCGPCDFLDEYKKGAICKRTTKYIANMPFCETGPLLRVPKRGEMNDHIGKIQMVWQNQDGKETITGREPTDGIPLSIRGITKTRSLPDTQGTRGRSLKGTSD